MNKVIIKFMWSLEIVIELQPLWLKRRVPLQYKQVLSKFYLLQLLVQGNSPQKHPKKKKKIKLKHSHKI